VLLSRENRRIFWRGAAAAALAPVLLAALLPADAFAHVKWFAHYDIVQQPLPLKQVFSPVFWQLIATAAILLWLLSYVERIRLGAAFLGAIERVSAGFRPRTEAFYRGGTAVFFAALFALGGIILTPELKTDWAAISWLEAGISLGMLWRRTMIVSALGIAFLYAYGVASYGIFHMLDYPIFLALAAYLGLTGLDLKLFNLRPLDVARWGASITLMWASIEKWAYPDWTYPLLQSRPEIALNLDPVFYMTAAGVAEFSLAFALLWTPLVRRSAAIVLAFMFIGAVLDFGKIDAIGHLMIIVILFGIIADDQPDERHAPLLAPLWYCASLVVFVAAYYGLHAAIYNTSIW
jgi:hypothetical protein